MGVPEELSRQAGLLRDELARREGLLGPLLQSHDEGVVFLDDSGVILHTNAEAAVLLGTPPDELVGTMLGFPLAPGEAAELEFTGPDGKSRALELRVAEVRFAGVALFLTRLRDVTLHRETERELKASRERFALAAESTRDGLWEWNLATGKAFFSRRWKTMLGYSDDEVEDDIEEWFSRVHPEDRTRLKGMLQAHLHGGGVPFEVVHRMLHKDGGYLWMEARGKAVANGSARASRIAGSQTDVTEQRLERERTLHDALHDPLTGLPNRVLFFERIHSCIKRAKRLPHYLYAVLFLDLDRFKVVNDGLGHDVGDRLLAEIATRVRRCLRPGDSVARLGGDEFSILLDDIRGTRDAVRVARRVQQQLSAAVVIDGHEIYTAASIGIALGGPEYRRPDEILRDADAAMYRAKERGKGRYEIFDRHIHEEAMDLLRLETDLRRACEQDQFSVLYQPIVSLDTGGLDGFEALLRWNHPDRGLLAPAEFLNVAEEAGLMGRIDRWVIETSCREACRWERREGAPLTISINLAPRSFSDPSFIPRVDRILARTGVDPRRVKIEITEDVLSGEEGPVLDVLHELKARDIHLYVDDFGTGYSALSRLQRLPVDMLKIDRSFISDLERNPENREIVRTIVSLARGLELDVIAEGVETATQVEILRDLGCPHGQGYWFSVPLSVARTRELVKNGPVFSLPVSSP